MWDISGAEWKWKPQKFFPEPEIQNEIEFCEEEKPLEMCAEQEM